MLDIRTYAELLSLLEEVMLRLKTRWN